MDDPRFTLGPPEGAPPPLVFPPPAARAGTPTPARGGGVRGWLPAATVTLLYGAGGEGKTLLLQQLMSSVASGTPWLGLQVQRGRVLGLFSEDDEDEMHRRQDGINRALGIGYEDLAEMWWTCPVGSDNTLLRFEQDGSPKRTARFLEFASHARLLRPAVIALDVAADLYGGNENDRGQVAQFLKALLGSLARDTGAAVVVAAHPSKSSIATGDLDSGSTGWNGGVRTRLTLATPKAQEGEPVDETARVLRRAKANYAKRGDEIELRFRDGVLHPKLTLGSGMVASLDRRKCEDVFMELLDLFTSQDRRLSDNPHAGNSAPKLFAQHPKASSYKIADFRRAMNTLFTEGRIKLERYGRPSDTTWRLMRDGAASTVETEAE